MWLGGSPGGLKAWINSTCRCSSASWSCLPSSCFLEATSSSKRFSRSRIFRVKLFISSVCTGVRPNRHQRQIGQQCTFVEMSRLLVGLFYIVGFTCLLLLCLAGFCVPHSQSQQYCVMFLNVHTICKMAIDPWLFIKWANEWAIER